MDKEGVTQYGRVNADGEVVTGSFRPNDTAEAGAASSVEADAASSAETATGSVDTHAADGPANIPALYQLAQDAAANRQATPAGTAKEQFGQMERRPQMGKAYGRLRHARKTQAVPPQAASRTAQ